MECLKIEINRKDLCLKTIKSQSSSNICYSIPSGTFQASFVHLFENTENWSEIHIQNIIRSIRDIKRS